VLQNVCGLDPAQALDGEAMALIRVAEERIAGAQEAGENLLG
jgi:hypothetical protein